MAEQRPLVRVNGSVTRLPVGDTLPDTRPVARLSSNQTNLAPGDYDLDTSGSTFTVLPANVVGTWTFGSSNNSTGTTPVSFLDTGGRTYTDSTGAQVSGAFGFDMQNRTVRISKTEAAGLDYRVMLSSNGAVSKALTPAGPAFSLTATATGKRQATGTFKALRITSPGGGSIHYRWTDASGAVAVVATDPTLALTTAPIDVYVGTGTPYFEFLRVSADVTFTIQPLV